MSQILVLKECTLMDISCLRQVLQGNDDEVVPPPQSWTIVDGIIKSKGHVEAHFFDGEQHGWRMSETIKKALEFEREWYEKNMVRSTT
jgi:dipeptidyl aminopeptidase/acylaminoacyl peptidase